MTAEAAGRGAGRLRGAACGPWVSRSSFHSADAAKGAGVPAARCVSLHGGAFFTRLELATRKLT